MQTNTNALAQNASPRLDDGDSQALGLYQVTEGTFALGDVLNDTYRLDALLGEGGMGQVFEAHDLLLNRRVAIKVALPAAKLWSMWSLEREGQALGALRHPSLVTVHCMGVHAGVQYLVMEFIQGVSLATRLDRYRFGGERFALDEALEILAAIAEALVLVHEAGLSHRDLSPGNVMLAPAGRVVLMDFGTALPEFSAGRQHIITGSPGYMAPEAILNCVRRGAGRLVDLYALGAIAYELVTGRVPYPEQPGMSAWEDQLSTVSAPVPSVAEVEPSVPRELAALITNLLAKAPEDRPESAEAVVWSLRSIHAGRVKLARATSGAVSRRTARPSAASWRNTSPFAGGFLPGK